MTLYLSNRDGSGKTSEEGHYKFQTSMWAGNVVGSTALKVSQNTTPGMSVIVAAGQFKIDTSQDYSYTGWNTADTVVNISTADPSNPRITSIIAYVDKGAATSASPPNNPGIVKLIAVNGTPAASPTAPSAGTIQTAVGSGNPYIVLANITVGAGATQILNAAISDQRILVTIGANLINTASITDSAVTTSKIADLNVTTNKLANLSVTTAKLANGSIDDTKWRNLIAFHAYRSATRNLSASTWTIIAPDNIYYNYGSGYSNIGDIGRFTAPVNGIYSFTANVYTEAAVQTRAILSFYVNNSAERSRVRDDTSTAIRRLNGTTVLYMNAGDYIDARCWLASAASITHLETWFEGHIVTRT